MIVGKAQTEDDLRFAVAREALLTYLRHKVEIGDFHGVSDAANDLRVLEAEHAVRKEWNVPAT